jgi:ferredoxin-type protein NapH
MSLREERCGSRADATKLPAQASVTSRRQRIRRTLLLAFLLLFPLTFNYYSPALPVMGALEGIAVFSLFFWAAWATTSLVLGRAACGWICPLGALQEVTQWARGHRPRALRFVPVIRWVLFGAWIATIAWAIVRGGGLRRVDLLFETEHVVSWDDVHGAFVYVGMFGLVLLVALPLGGRGFCRHLCWWAPLNVLGSKMGTALRLPVLRLSWAGAQCGACRTCEESCPVGLPVRALASGRAPRTECLLCATCVDACPEAGLALTFRT